MLHPRGALSEHSQVFLSDLNPAPSSLLLLLCSLLLWATLLKINPYFQKKDRSRPCTQGIFCTAYPEMVAPFFVSTFIDVT